MGFALQAARGDQKSMGLACAGKFFKFREWRRNNNFLDSAEVSYYTRGRWRTRKMKVSALSLRRLYGTPSGSESWHRACLVR